MAPHLDGYLIHTPVTGDFFIFPSTLMYVNPFKSKVTRISMAVNFKNEFLIMQGKLLRQALDKFMVSPVAQNARVQVCLPNGEMYDVKGIQLMENKLLGVRETHRLVITIEQNQWTMGKVIKKL